MECMYYLCSQQRNKPFIYEDSDSWSRGGGMLCGNRDKEAMT